MELNRDGDGFLVDTNDWSEEVMIQMAEEDGFLITDEIRTYINKAREMLTKQVQYQQFVTLQKNLVWTEKQVSYMKYLNLVL